MVFEKFPEELIFNFGKIFAFQNNIKDLITVLEKKELSNYKIYLMNGVAEGFHLSQNKKDLTFFIYFLKDYPFQLSIII